MEQRRVYREWLKGVAWVTQYRILPSLSQVKHQHFSSSSDLCRNEDAGCRYQNLHQGQIVSRGRLSLVCSNLGAFFSFSVWHEQWWLATCLLAFAWRGVWALRKAVMNENMNVSQESYGLGSSDNLTSLNYSWPVYYLHYCLLICWHKASGCSLLPKATDDMQLWNRPFGNMRPMTSIRTKRSDTPLRESDYG